MSAETTPAPRTSAATATGAATALPTLFLSHGSPMLSLLEAPARSFLEALGPQLPRPRAILVASAHWETAQPSVNAVERNETIHDFYGFPQALFDDAGLMAGLNVHAGQMTCRAVAEALFSDRVVFGEGMSGRVATTMPPECWERWRGRP